MRGFMPDEFHEPFFCFALDFENDFPFQVPKPVVRQKERNENRRNANGHKPFVAQVTRGMESKSLLSQLIVEALNQRLQRGAVEFEAELGDALLQQLVVAQTAPVGVSTAQSLRGRNRSHKSGFDVGLQFCSFERALPDTAPGNVDFSRQPRVIAACCWINPAFRFLGGFNPGAVSR
jgi:hypothetical protein